MDPIEFYSSSGIMTELGQDASAFEDLPTDIASLCEVVQGNLLHIFWSERYGRVLSESEKQTVNIRSVAEKLALIKSLDAQSLNKPRPLEKRQIGNCRDFTLFLTSILRYQGLPARARCGFGAYFIPNHYEDHWVCEYWNPGKQRWVMVDSQLDTFQQETLGINFDPLDVPSNQFVTGGKAWQMCRSGQADPQQFGIFDMHGWWFIWGDLVRDFLALNKVEILPWDGGWGYLNISLNDPPPAKDDLLFYDRIAALTLAGNSGFPQLRAEYDSDPRWKLPTELLPKG
jgi:Transglutaminase-like superfamily